MDNLATLQEKYKAQLLEIYRKSKSAKQDDSNTTIYDTTITKKETVINNQQTEIITLETPITLENDKTESNKEDIQPSGQENKIDKFVTEAYGGTGELIVDVSTAGSAIPIENALVIVEKDLLDGNIILVTTTTTDENGRSIDKIKLATKPKELSFDPNVKQPYAKYRLLVKAKGFKSEEFSDIAIFDGVTSIENVSLMPI